ncbi:aldehyde dehydrogenase family protein [Rhodococcus wratislaviensis]|uniref:aldehyde dehydrogenase family protein n=1 Tax=Rhodococcus wratislaviensis TaxID=44752 RepID=UPI00365E0D52
MNTHPLNIDIPGLEQVMIAGQWREPAGDGRLRVINPTTGQTIVDVPDPSVGDADAAISAARQAFDDGPWTSMTVSERVEKCRRFGEELEARFPSISRAWALESGYTISYGDVVSGAGRAIWNDAIDVAAGLSWEEKRNRGHSRVVLRREPIGVVLAIMSSNGPVAMTGLKVIPALIAGCTVVMKYAQDSQLVARLIADAAVAAQFPPGVVSMLAAEVKTTQYMVEHHGIDLVHMTGSLAAATDVLQRSVAKFGRTVFELGGKSPAILLDDCDLDAVMPDLVSGGIAVNGQFCVALSRVLVSENRYAEVVQRMKDSYAALKQGDPLDPGVDMGPLSGERALHRVEAMVKRAVEQGARVVHGGRRPPQFEGGFFYEPTLLADVTPDMEIAQEEVFGPVIVVMKYRDVEDAVRIANDSKYGLAASVFAGDPETAFEVATRLRTGTVGVNVAGVCLTEPFGGVKKSGWGREGGPEGILEFTQYKQYLLGGSLFAEVGKEQAS